MEKVFQDRGGRGTGKKAGSGPVFNAEPGYEKVK